MLPIQKRDRALIFAAISQAGQIINSLLYQWSSGVIPNKTLDGSLNVSVILPEPIVSILIRLDCAYDRVRLGTSKATQILSRVLQGWKF